MDICCPSDLCSRNLPALVGARIPEIPHTRNRVSQHVQSAMTPYHPRTLLVSLFLSSVSFDVSGFVAYVYSPSPSTRRDIPAFATSLSLSSDARAYDSSAGAPGARERCLEVADLTTTMVVETRDCNPAETLC